MQKNKTKLILVTRHVVYARPYTWFEYSNPQHDMQTHIQYLGPHIHLFQVHNATSKKYIDVCLLTSVLSVVWSICSSALV